MKLTGVPIATLALGVWPRHRRGYQCADGHHFHGLLRSQGLSNVRREGCVTFPSGPHVSAAECRRVQRMDALLERLAMLVDERLERHRRTAAELLDEVVRALEDPVLVVDRDLPQVLEEEIVALLASAPGR